MIKKIALIAAFACLPLTAHAVTVSSASQIDIAAVVDLDNSIFDPAGTAVFQNPGIVIFSTGDFASLPIGTNATLSNIDFSTPGVVWSAGGFTFTATAFTTIFDGLIAGFKAEGLITGNGFDPTETVMNFSVSRPPNVSQAGGSATTSPVPIPAGFLLLSTALAGFAVSRRG